MFDDDWKDLQAFAKILHNKLVEEEAPQEAVQEAKSILDRADAAVKRWVGVPDKSKTSTKKKAKKKVAKKAS